MQYSEANYDSVAQPFFQQDFNKITDETKITNETKLITKDDVERLIKDKFTCEFPKALKNFFINKPYASEIYTKEWTIMSLNNIISRFETINKDKINVIDIGFKYMGMGHILILFYDPVKKCYFYRYDGGSNGYDRIHNYNLLKNYKNNGNMNVGFTFEEFFEQINGEMKEKSCVF